MGRQLLRMKSRRGQLRECRWACARARARAAPDERLGALLRGLRPALPPHHQRHHEPRVQQGQQPRQRRRQARHHCCAGARRRAATTDARPLPPLVGPLAAAARLRRLPAPSPSSQGPRGCTPGRGAGASCLPSCIGDRCPLIARECRVQGDQGDVICAMRWAASKGVLRAAPLEVLQVLLPSWCPPAARLGCAPPPRRSVIGRCLPFCAPRGSQTASPRPCAPTQCNRAVRRRASPPRLAAAPTMFVVNW